GGPAPDAGAPATADGRLSAVAALAAACSGCHSAPAEGIVSLDGKSAEEIAAALHTYREDEAGGTVMHRLARGYSEAQVDAVAAHLSAGQGG
ncbi:MAG: hypothetical protein MI723_10615, partial [Caulobacterales bacterium]|nr:hypothetical protein [Caulobacterales bacterium]